MRTILSVAFTMLVSLIYAQGRIYINERSYPATEGLSFYQNSKSSSLVEHREYVKLSIGKKNKGGIVLLEKENTDFFNKDLFIGGQLLMYLSNGKVIKCIDRKKYGYSDDTASAVYYLTSSEMNLLKKSDIKKIRYSLFLDNGLPISYTSKNYSASTYDDTAVSVNRLFR